MQFSLDLIDIETAEKTVVVYDPHESTLKDLDGKEIPLYNLLSPSKSFTKRLTISLGFACNFRCDYCLQAHTKMEKPSEEQISQLIKELNSEDLSKTRVEFWGGEPLLYYPTILEIAKNLKDVNEFLIITNGSLLTREIAEELLDLNFSIAISYDCQNQEKLRGTDPLKKNPDLFRWLVTEHKDKVSINTVMNKDNYITKDRLDWLESILGTRDLNIGGEGFVIDYGTNINTFNVNVYQDIIAGEGLANGYYRSVLDSFIKSIRFRRSIDDVTTMCGVDSENYEVKSLSGKSMTCHNFTSPFTPNTLHTRKNCRDCLVAHLCKGQCPAIKEDTPQFKRNCEMNKKIFTDVLRVAIWILTDYKYQVYNIRRLDV